MSMSIYADLLNKVSVATVDFDTERDHTSGTCKCCTPPEIVQKHEEIWAQKWKAISKQRRIERKQQRLAGEGDWYDKRWYHEYQAFEEMKWGFY